MYFIALPLVILATLVCGPPSVWALPQAPQPQQVEQQQPRPAPAGIGLVPPAAEPLQPSYILGAGDVVQIRVPGSEEIPDRPYRVEPSGEMTIPLIGPLKVAGMTLDQFRAELNTRLKAFYVNPQAIVTMVQFRSDPVFFIGAFRSPGIYPLQGRRTLVEMLTSVGGMATNATRRIRLARRKEMGPIPLPNAVESPEGKGMTVDIPLATLTQEINPPEDIPLQPYDLITAERAEMVYLSGEVNKPGAYELGERETIGILQLVSTAGGPTANANLRKARILRSISNSSRRVEIPMDLSTLLAGRYSEVKLMPNDVLYVPRNSRRVLWGRVALVASALIPTLIYVSVR